MKKNTLILPADYADWLVNLKRRIAGARQRAVLSANQEQIHLYHYIGKEILERQSRQGWGAKVIDRVSADLRAAFPDMKGFSSRNLKYMSYFAKICPDLQIGQQTAAQLPWFHIVILLTQVADPVLREWYAREAIQHAWPRDTLTVQIKSQLHLRKGAAVTNFNKRLTASEAGLAVEILKDPYHFDFLLDTFYRGQLRELVPPLLAKWQKELGVQVAEWGIKKMKTRWGSCNSRARRVWINLELAKKPVACIDYLVLHELVHLVERNHGERFIALMDKHMPHWRLHRQELNAAPLGNERWGY
jgi:predicted metal-dependent hydrolase